MTSWAGLADNFDLRSGSDTILVGANSGNDTMLVTAASATQADVIELAYMADRVFTRPYAPRDKDVTRGLTRH